MALTYSPPGALGSPCPDFKLPSVDGKTWQRTDFDGKPALVVMFICNHCPYVQAIESRLLNLAKEYSQVAFVGVCSNDSTENPEDSPAQLLARWQSQNYGFPYLIDDSQEFARACGAVCTPDLYVFDRDHLLRYRGRLDDSWRNEALVRTPELKVALDLVLAGKIPDVTQNPSMGCSIKWKNG